MSRSIIIYLVFAICLATLAILTPCLAIDVTQPDFDAAMAAANGDLHWNGEPGDHTYVIWEWLDQNQVEHTGLVVNGHLTIGPGIHVEFHVASSNQLTICGNGSRITTEGGANQDDRVYIGNPWDWGDNGARQRTFWDGIIMEEGVGECDFENTDFELICDVNHYYPPTISVEGGWIALDGCTFNSTGRAAVFFNTASEEESTIPILILPRKSGHGVKTIGLV